MLRKGKSERHWISWNPDNKKKGSKIKNPV